MSVSAPSDRPPVPDSRAALRDLWIAEMWPVCRELPREERAAARARVARPVA